MVNQIAFSQVEHDDPRVQFATAYRDIVAIRHPSLSDRLNQQIFLNVDQMCRHLESLEAVTGHQSFLDEKLGGRGQAYRDGQLRYPLARRVGYEYLIRTIESHPTSAPLHLRVVNDALGGSGTLCRAVSQICPFGKQPYWITSDPNPAQIVAALNSQFPAAPQSAQNTLFRDCVADHALFAYGTHHIPRNERQLAIDEAYRYLTRGGQIIIQDFEENSPTAQWYSDGLHNYTMTGHDCDHFSVSELKELLDNAGFVDVRIENQYDPFIFEGADPLVLRGQLLEHLVNMFGMVKLHRKNGESVLDYHDRLDAVLAPYARFTASEVNFHEEAVRCFSLCQVRPGLWRAVYPRVAIVAIGTKPN